MPTMMEQLLSFDFFFQAAMLIAIGAAVGAMTTMILLRSETKKTASFKHLESSPSAVSTSSESACSHCNDGNSSFDSLQDGKARRYRLPPLIILVRHGESECNADHTLWRTKPDNLVCLTQKGLRQASDAGRRIEDIFSQFDNDNDEVVEDEKVVQGSMRGKTTSNNGTKATTKDALLENPGGCNCTKINRPIKRVHLVVSPFERTIQTASALRPWFEHRIVRTEVECRIREQEFGNLQGDETTLYREEQKKVGRFWYRFPTGESGSDVYDRVKSWWNESILHVNERVGYSPVDAVVVVTHGLTMRFLLMQLYSWSPTTFHSVWNANNCAMYVLKKNLDKPGISPYVLEDSLGDMPQSSIDITLEFKSKTPDDVKTIQLKDYLSIPPPRTRNIDQVKEKIKEQYPDIDVGDIKTITFMPFIDGGIVQTRTSSSCPPDEQSKRRASQVIDLKKYKMNRQKAEMSFRWPSSSHA